MTFTHKCKQAIPLVLGWVLLGTLVFSVWFFLIKPWPGVEASDDWKLVDAKRVYSPGDELTWEKTRVCIPEGETTVTVLFNRELPEELGEFQRVAYTRIFHYTRYDCRQPNTTTITLPVDLTSGEHTIVIRACTNTPSPIDTCIETPGPTFLVLRTPR